MAEKTQLRAFVLFLFLFVALSLSGASFAAVTVTPSIPDFRPNSTGGYFGSAGKWVPYVPASNAYTTAGAVSIGGKAISVPASVPLAATAGAAVKTAMRLNPTALVGTLAAGWLLEQGMEYLAGQWMKNEGGVAYYRIYHGGTAQWLRIPEQGQTWCDLTHGYATTYDGSNPATVVCKYQGSYVDGNPAQWYTPPATQVPATPSDFDALPNPMDDPGVAGEAPGAAYMPDGVPVGQPNYTSGNYPMGAPYKAPDGTTVQPMASVTNISNTNTVNVSTYNITTHNADGTPTSNPTPQPTDEKPDECEAHPERVGCATLGEVPPETLPTVTHTMQFTPEASPITGACPAPIAMPGGHMLSFQSACDAMVQIKPVVLALAGVLVGFMVIGSIKNG